jgi:hypothetical protein
VIVEIKSPKNKFQYHLKSRSQIVAVKVNPKNNPIIKPTTQPPQGPCANTSDRSPTTEMDLQYFQNRVLISCVINF